MDNAATAKASGNAAFGSGDYDEAVKCFSRAIDLNPMDHVLYSNRSGAYAMINSFDKALTDAQECVKRSPGWAKGYSRLGLAYFKLGKVKEAIDAYNAGLKLDPENAQLKEGLVQVKRGSLGFLMKDRFKLKVASLLTEPKFRAYADANPSYADEVLRGVENIFDDPTTMMSGDVMHSDPKVREAIVKLLGMEEGDDEELQENIKREEELKRRKEEKQRKTHEAKKDSETKTPRQRSAEECKDKGNVFYKNRQFEEALAMYDEAINLDPRNILYLNNKAAVFLEMGEYEKCLEICRKAIEIRYEVKADYSHLAKVYARMSACHRKMGNLGEACAMLEKSLVEDNNPQTRAQLRELERIKMKTEMEAYWDDEKAAQHKEKGNEFFKLGDMPAAKHEYDEAIRRNPKDPFLYSNRAAAYCKLMEYPSALKDVEKAIEIDPKFVKAWSRKGTIHYFMKAYAKSQEAYARGLALDPQNVECLKGREQVIKKIMETQGSSQVDEEQVKQAMNDPEVQQILSDPQFRIILDNLNQNPMLLQEYLQDPKIAQGLNRLISAGIVRFQ